MKLNIFLVYLLLLGSLGSYAQADSSDYQKAVARANNGNFAEALIYFSSVVDKNPDDAYAWFNRGYTKAILKLEEEAISDFNKSIEINPSYKKAYLNRGISKRNLLNFAGAQADFKLAIINAPEYAEAYYHRGYLYELLENKDSACHYYKIAADFGLKQMQDKLTVCDDPKKTFDKHIVRLKKQAASKEYGFSEGDPVKVGGGPLNQREYLDLLRDINGKPVKYYRVGSCCGYKLESAFMGMALLDKYRITYTDEGGTEKTAIVFISFYEYEEPAVLFGFKTIPLLN